MKLPVDLQDGESVVMVLRRHPVYLALKLVAVLLIILVPVGLLLWLGIGGLTGQILWGIAALWAVFWLVRAYFIWYRHQNDLWIVTNQRLIDSYKRNWFHSQVASADLVNVQDISVARSGLLATIFNFGDVRCQTAGEVSAFVLSDIPHPSRVLTLVDTTRDAARSAQSGFHRALPPDYSLPPNVPPPAVPDRPPGPQGGDRLADRGRLAQTATSQISGTWSEGRSHERHCSST
jgi:hypothetical protein